MQVHEIDPTTYQGLLYQFADETQRESRPLPVHVCLTCGAVVADIEQHQRWAGTVRIATEVVTPSQLEARLGVTSAGVASLDPSEVTREWVGRRVAVKNHGATVLVGNVTSAVTLPVMGVEVTDIRVTDETGAGHTVRLQTPGVEVVDL